MAACIAGDCVEADDELSGEGDAHDHFGFSGCGEALMHEAEVGVVASDHGGDEHEQRAHGGSPAPHGSAALALAAVVGERGEADELGDGLVGERSDLGQVGQHGGDGAARDALDGAQRLREAAPERIGVEQRGPR